MFPQRELNRLALYKVALRRDVTFRRVQCVRAVAPVIRPLAWCDRALALWRGVRLLAPITAVPLRHLLVGLLIRRGFLRWIFTWGPLIAGVGRGLRSAGRRS